MGMYHPHERVQLDPGPGRTKQSFSEESNINLIMKKYEKTGMLDHLNQYEGRYGDFIAAPDYHTAMNSIRSAGEMFMQIPATIRAKFDNDPAQFLAFVQNPDNREQMVEMGLAHHDPADFPDNPPPGVTEPGGPSGASTDPAPPNEAIITPPPSA